MPTMPPVLPGNMAGTPPAPGAGPALAPGAGAGNHAAALAQGKVIMPVLLKILGALPVGSKEYNSVLRMISEGSKVFGEAQEGNLVPAGIAQLATAARNGSSPLSAVAPGLSPNLPPPPSGGATPAAAPSMAA